MSVQSGNNNSLSRNVSAECGTNHQSSPNQNNSAASIGGSAAGPQNGWVLSPVLDLLVLSNLFWPLLLLIQHDDGFDGRSAVLFWQVYFVTTPHRWITLALVFLDRQRFHQQPRVFIGFALLVVCICLGVRISTGSLTCLLAIDYLWNAWHFAAQHHGVYRIYGRLTDPHRVSGLSIEKWLLRLFLIYVIARVATSTFPHAIMKRSLETADWCFVTIPLWLLLQDLRGWNRYAAGRIAYLISVSLLYLSLLWAVHFRHPALVLSLATASALFHAIEYLALTGWTVNRRSAQIGSPQLGILGWLAPRWVLALTMFIVILGSSGWLMEQNLFETWLLINVIVAFLHYGYDGMIWRGSSLRKGRTVMPATFSQT